MSENTSRSEYDLRFFQTTWVICFLFGVLSRFWNIFQIGMIGSDEFYYWDVAYQWSKDGVFLTGHYRPFIYYVYSFIMKVFGPNDWVIKLLNVTLDVSTGICLFFIYKLYFKDRRGAFLVSSLYLIVPAFIFYARRELVHTPSIFFLELTLLFFPSLFLEKLKGVWVFLSGVFFSMAWNTHPDLFVLFPVFIFFIFVYYRESLFDSIILALLFTLGAASVFIIFSFTFHPFEMVFNILKNHKAQSKLSVDSLWVKWGKIYYLYIKENLGTVVLAFFSAAILKIVVNLYRGYKNVYEIFLLALIVTYMLMCGLLFSRIYIPRLLLPLCPLIIMLVVRMSLHFSFKKKYASAFIGCLLISLIVGEKVHSLDDSFYQEVSYYRRLENEIGEKIDANNRLLVAPIIFYHIHGPLTKKVYLKGQSRYLVNAPGEKMADIIQRNKISYIVWASENYDERIFGKNRNSEYVDRLKSLYSLEYQDYTLDKEHELFGQQMHMLGAELIKTNSLGEFYRVKKR